MGGEFMLKVSTVIDAKAQKALSNNTMIASIIALVIGALGIVAYVILSTFINNSYIDILLIFCIPFAIGLIYVITINKNIKAVAVNQFTSEYDFDTDYFNVTSSMNGDIVGTQKVYYRDLYKIREKDEYIFIYINKFNVFIVKKSNISGEDLIALRSLLKLTDGA